MPPSSPWSFPSSPASLSTTSATSATSFDTSESSAVLAGPSRVAAAFALAALLAAGPGAAHGASPGRLVAALDPAALALAWPAGVAAAAEAAPAPVAAPVAPTAPASSPEAVPARWEVRTQDITLSRTLERWAAQAGYRLKWDAARNFLIGASDVYQGGFEDALQAVLGSAGIRGSDYPLEACIYANTPPLVRITRQGEQSRECHAS